MAFSFGNPGNTMAGGAGAGAGGLTVGADLEVIQTEGLGFLSIAGEAKVQLTSRWSPVPAPTASLISIASSKGLVAAASPDVLIIATTESVRKAFQSPKNGDSEVRPFEPQAKLPLPMRISHLSFTADEQFLIISAEQGGGLAIYDVQALSQGSSQTSFELSTNGETLRALVPNPMPEMAELCAIVTNSGKLLMANLKERTLVNSQNGPVLKAQVSCASWSTKGKQLVAGMANGTVSQMTPDGTEKAQIPKPPSLGDYYVSSISWLENNVFLVVHNETNGQPGSSAYHIVTRHVPHGQQPSFEFRKLTDPVEPFGSDKTPNHHILRIRDYPPSLHDLLLVSSTATESIGLLTRSKTPLASDKPADKIADVFTTTEFADDSKRAQLPLSEDLSETFPVGVALDLSSKDKVYKPIPGDEIEYSPGPLPGFWALNNEGVLSCWWIIYNDSIRQGVTYPGMAAVAGTAAAQPAQPSSPAAASPFARSTTAAPAFGSGSTSAFGSGSALGAKPSPWGSAQASTTTTGSTLGSSSFGGAGSSSTPAFGAPSFGTPSFGKPAAPAFGQSSAMGLGMRASPWASGSTAAAAPAFGQHGFGSAAPSALGAGKVFGSSTATTSPSSGGFASFASKGGFSSLTSGTTGGSIFGSSSTSKPLGAFGSGTPEVSMDTDTAFPPPTSKPQGTNALGTSSPFVLGTTFKPDTTSVTDNEKPKEEKSGSLFGNNFGLALGDTAKEALNETSKDEDMDATTPVAEQPKPMSILASTTPTTTPAPSKFFGTSPAPTTGPFGSASKTASSGFPAIFGRNSLGSKKLEDAAPKVPEVKAESALKNPFKTESVLKNPFKSLEAPLPPESTSKASFPLGDSSSSSTLSVLSPQTVTNTPMKVAEDAPLPPDFTAKTPKPKDEAAAPSEKTEPSKTPEAAPLPPDFLQVKPEQKTEEPPLPPLPTAKPPSSEEAPLPPDFLAKPKDKEPVPEAAPLPPDFLSKPSSQQPPPVPSVPSSDDDDLEESEVSEEEESQEQGSEAASEGSGVDVAKDLSPSSTALGHTPGFTPQSSFGGMAGSTFSSLSRPGPDQSSRRLFGEVSRNAPVFAQPAPISPRSPSPVRSAVPTRMLRPEASRSVSAPGMASQILGSSRSAAPGPSFGKSITARAQPIEDPNVVLQRQILAKRQQEENEALKEDEEYEHIQTFIESHIEPTPEIGDFVAFTSSNPESETSTIASQAEALYKDINGMIQTLALNARTLKGFIKGHTELYKDGGPRTKEDLEDPDSWVLCEAEDLGQILDHELAEELEDGRLKDFGETWDACQDLLRDMPKLRAKQEDMKRVVGTLLDPDQAAATRSLPLSAEQAEQQNDLRRSYAQMTKLLAEAESAVTMLKTKIASAAGAAGRGAAVPTVEAVMKTIVKMTSMAEKRSGDIDVLENQMRKLRMGSVGAGGAGSREGTPFMTPPRRSVASPDPRKSLASSVASYGGGVRGTPPRRKISGFSEEEKREIRQKREKKQAVLDRLRAGLEKAGPNVSRLTDEDYA
ncbi:Nuclear pore complex subunit [Pleurostoma richardsiae]|uniref:Nuclear pore complex subunit n=1 Tax=Pleurostoma richardsiae TaxID=41990 RepID=A0AA38RJI5_9PEZI|nr:Nuclear pore complex subunit [Pleurostoma richardsiae]